jgi:hypothetical protein
VKLLELQTHKVIFRLSSKEEMLSLWFTENLQNRLAFGSALAHQVIST